MNRASTWLLRVWESSWCVTGIALFLATLETTCVADIQELNLPPTADIQQARFHYRPPADQQNCQLLLVLSPGCNGSGEHLIRQPNWQEFADKHNIGLLGTSFVSDVNDLKSGKGYYYASQGSGDLLLEAVRHFQGKQNVQLLLYGFSGGAHFTARFAEWKPEKIIAWCAYSAAWWDEPRPKENSPPALIACGENDFRLGASLMFFKKGRAAGKPWLWLELRDTGHSTSKELDQFVMCYFAATLENSGDQSLGVWLDIDLETFVTPEFVHQYPSLTGVLPNPALLEDWKALNAPR